MKHCWETTQDIGKNIVWGQIGPKLLKESVDKFNLQDYVKSPNVFCPIHHGEAKLLVSEDWTNDYGKRVAWQRPFDLEVECYGLHLWNESWRNNNIDKDGDWPHNTLYEQLKRKYK